MRTDHQGSLCVLTVVLRGVSQVEVEYFETRLRFQNSLLKRGMHSFSAEAG